MVAPVILMDYLSQVQKITKYLGSSQREEELKNKLSDKYLQTGLHDPFDFLSELEAAKRFIDRKRLSPDEKKEVNDAFNHIKTDILKKKGLSEQEMASMRLTEWTNYLKGKRDGTISLESTAAASGDKTLEESGEVYYKLPQNRIFGSDYEQNILVNHSKNRISTKAEDNPGVSMEGLNTALTETAFAKFGPGNPVRIAGFNLEKFNYDGPAGGRGPSDYKLQCIDSWKRSYARGLDVDPAQWQLMPEKDRLQAEKMREARKIEIEKGKAYLARATPEDDNVAEVRRTSSTTPPDEPSRTPGMGGPGRSSGT